MVKLFTHTDLDGIGCAVLAKLVFSDEVDITYCDYTNINNNVLEYLNSCEKLADTVLITDISISDEIAKVIDENFDNFYLLDHHPTALGLNKYIWCTVMIENENNIKTSGTELFYDWLIEGGYLIDSDDKDIYKFVELVRNYDTWRWTELGEDGLICKQVNDLLYLYGRDKFIRWCLTEINDFTFPRLYSEDKFALEIKQKEIDDYVSKKNNTILKMDLCGRKCGFVFAEKYFSELGNKLCKLNPDIDFVAMIDIDGGTVSYRTVRDDIDLGNDVAKVFCGGGHPKAAGSQFAEEIKLIIIENIFELR